MNAIQKDSNKNNQRIIKNSIILYIRMIVTLLISLYTSRVILKILGFEDFGIYNAVGGLVTMFTFLNSSMNVATSRFISVGLGKHNLKLSKLIYGQAVIIHLIIAIIITIILETIGLWFLYNKLTIPEGRIDAAYWVLQASIIGCFITIISTQDQATIISHEKMGAFAFFSLFDAIAKLGIIFIIPILNYDALKLYSVLIVLVIIIERIILIIYCHKSFDEVKTKIKFDGSLFKSMSTFAGWNILSNLAYMSTEQGINILLNIFFGPVLNAARGIANQVTNIVRTFVSNIRTSINPQIYKSYSEANYKYMHTLVFASAKFSYFAILVMALPLVIIVDSLLKIWLDDVPPYTSSFIICILIYLLIESFATTLTVSVHATGKIKSYQIAESIAMLLTLPIAYIILKMGYNPIGAYLTQIIVSLFTMIIRLIIALPKINIKWKDFNKAVIVPIGKVSIISILPLIVAEYLTNIKDTRNSVFFALVEFIFTLIIIYFQGLTPSEQDFIKRK